MIARIHRVGITTKRFVVAVENDGMACDALFDVYFGFEVQFFYYIKPDLVCLKRASFSKKACYTKFNSFLNPKCCKIIPF